MPGGGAVEGGGAVIRAGPCLVGQGCGKEWGCDRGVAQVPRQLTRICSSSSR